MTIARAPGKVVLSGAYAVLEGAPCVVAAVSRYVVADSARPAAFVTPEVREALGARSAPGFDASALREGDRKLGLGSSAAIVVASLAALHLEDHPGPIEDAALCAAVFRPALEAHARAQQGGSGVDVAASAHGGVIVAQRQAAGLDVRRAALPPGLHVEVWAAPVSAATPELLRRVRTLKCERPEVYGGVMGPLSEGAEAGAAALHRQDTPALLTALARQAEQLRRLGELAGADIVTDPVNRLHAAALTEDAVVLPAGAGGGDVALYLGGAPPSDSLRALAAELAHRPLELSLGARGVHVV